MPKVGGKKFSYSKKGKESVKNRNKLLKEIVMIPQESPRPLAPPTDSTPVKPVKKPKSRRY